MSRPCFLFVTGKLAEPSLRRLMAEIAPAAGFDYAVAVLPISVVALATTSWVARHLQVASRVDRVILPGLCNGELAAVSESIGLPVERGPKDLRDLPEFFGRAKGSPAGYGAYDISILAEINHVQRLSLAEIRARVLAYRTSGADVIDLGCDPGETWSDAGATIRALREEGFRVSIDTFNPAEVAPAVAAGAELVLSVNSSNVD